MLGRADIYRKWMLLYQTTCRYVFLRTDFALKAAQTAKLLYTRTHRE
jgi:hypothetical protein